MSVERRCFDGNPESVVIKRRIFTKLRVQFGRHFSAKWRCLIFLVGCFLLYGVLVPATKKESIFTKEGVFGCDVFNLQFWKLRRSTLLRKVFSAAVEIRWRFSQKRFDLPAAGKSRWIIVKEANSSQWLGKTSGFFFVVFKSRSAFFKRNILHEFFLPDVSKLFTVVSDQAFSILPMIFLSCPS